jgi:hypothetical protein
VGLYLYINFLADINAYIAGNSSDGQVGIIAIEIMSVSSRIIYEAILKDEMCDEIRRVLTAYRWEKYVLVLHS